MSATPESKRPPGQHANTAWDPFTSGPRSGHETSASAPIATSSSPYSSLTLPAITSPKGGGALKAIDEKLEVTAASGTCSLRIPFQITNGRNSMTPDVSLSYDSAGGNGPFGMGWKISIPAISRKTSKGIPRYMDDDESDVFLLAGLEDLVPTSTDAEASNERDGYQVRSYRPRTEHDYTRIERWSKGSDCHWRTITAANVTSVYGQSDASRIMDSQSDRVFTWLLCLTYDTKGNAVEYAYKEEDSINVAKDQASERHRTDSSRSSNRYIKTIRYGNSQPNRDDNWETVEVPDDQWLFELAFDYGDHSVSNPRAAPDSLWSVRADAFSTYTAGFEIRTYRLCRRVLLFHHFPEELGTRDYLVRSMRLDYLESPNVSVLRTITQSGHALATDTTPPRPVSKSLPSVELDYSGVDVRNAASGVVTLPTPQNLPVGLADPYHWLDLDGTGKPGVLLAQDSAWYHLKNLCTYQVDYHQPEDGVAEVKFAPAEQLGSIPSSVAASGGAAFLDVDGNGQLDLVTNTAVGHGFYERTVEGDWTEFRSFSSWPLDGDGRGASQNLRYLDLTGDGLADIVISEADSLLWYPSLGTQGYGEGSREFAGASEAEGPRVLFNDGLEVLFLADMTGDGLSDIARVRSGDISYWPNMGYGRFGAKVAMDDAPALLGSWDEASSKRVRLADLDGSGTMDVMYFPPRGGVELYLNRSGNSWSQATLVDFPQIDTLSFFDVVDLFGIGVSSLVWSTKHSPGVASAMHYLDFSRGIKSHLLTTYRNGPVETRLSYQPSTAFHQRDQVSGRDWPTRLPFPVQCLSSVASFDYLSRSLHEKTYAYHDGYYDGLEREFRGFGKVEMTSAERFLLDSSPSFPTLSDAEGALLSCPPTLTISWYHTGCYEQAIMLDDLRRMEYYSPPALKWDSLSVSLRPSPESPAMTAIETRQACRSLKGGLLRQELYLLDGPQRQFAPLYVVDQSSAATRLQAATETRPGVFRVDHRETVSAHLEGNPNDPKVDHQLTLEVDEWGAVLKSAEVHYGRLAASRTTEHSDEDWAQQAVTKVQYSETDYTNAVDDGANYLCPLVADERQYQVDGVLPDRSSDPLGMLRVEELLEQVRSQMVTSKGYYDLSEDAGTRLLSRKVTRYRSDDLTKLLEEKEAESLALPGESYTLGLTSQILKGGAFPGSWLADPTYWSAAGYVHADNENPDSLWIPSGQQSFSDGEPSLAMARSSFFQASMFKDPFGNTRRLTLDKWQLGPAQTVDAMGNVNSAKLNYRTVQPELFTDENGNMSSTLFDELGAVVGQATMGKDGSWLGDTMQGFNPFLSETDVEQLRAQPLQVAANLLRNASVLSYAGLPVLNEAKGWQPGFLVTISRESHVSDLSDGTASRLQIAITYFDGHGHDMQRRTSSNASQTTAKWTVDNCKITTRESVVIRHYDAFVDSSHLFSRPDENAVMSATSFSDPLGRSVATLLPNATWAKTAHNAWDKLAYTAGDLVLVDDPYQDADVGIYLRGVPSALRPRGTWYQAMSSSSDVLDQQRAEASRVYSDTATAIWYDVCGNDFRTTEDNGGDAKWSVRTFRDIQGRVLQVNDSRGRIVTRNQHDMAGAVIHASSMDTGEVWTLNDVTGKIVRTLNSRGIERRTTYDASRRLLEQHSISSPGHSEVLVQKYVYGEDQAEPQLHNLRGNVYQISDQAQISTVEAYDYANRPIQGHEQLVVEYKKAVDWNGQVELEVEKYGWATMHDALGRVLSKSHADGSSVTHGWNADGLIESITLSGSAVPETAIMKEVQYNARGQPTTELAGNGTKTQYDYDRCTFNMTSKQTTTASGKRIQDLRFSMDCMARRVRIDDGAQQNVFFRGNIVSPTRLFTYDAIGRLVKATGRELLGQVGQDWVSAPYDSMSGASRAASPSDSQAMSGYTEEYSYDSEGNILSMKHSLSDSTVAGWTRNYQYREPSFLEPTSQSNNRLSSTTIDESSTTFCYDGLDGQAGLVTGMTGYSSLQWDYAGRLQATSTQTVINGGASGVTWYGYDSHNRRARKVTESSAAPDSKPNRTRDHMYVSGSEVELSREYQVSDQRMSSERWSWHVMMDSNKRLAIVEANKLPGENGPETRDGDNLSEYTSAITRFLVSDHVSSNTLELDENGEVVSYEEFSPFGASTYNAASSVEGNKRYRFSAKERDDGTGLYYFENRYYMPWLGRWLEPDPTGTQDGLNVYCYVSNDPVNKVDPTGLNWNILYGDLLRLIFNFLATSDDAVSLASTSQRYRTILQPLLNARRNTLAARATTDMATFTASGGSLDAGRFRALTVSGFLHAGDQWAVGHMVRALAGSASTDHDVRAQTVFFQGVLGAYRAYQSNLRLVPRSVKRQRDGGAASSAIVIRPPALALERAVSKQGVQKRGNDAKAARHKDMLALLRSISSSPPSSSSTGKPPGPPPPPGPGPGPSSQGMAVGN